MKQPNTIAQLAPETVKRDVGAVLDVLALRLDGYALTLREVLLQRVQCPSGCDHTAWHVALGFLTGEVVAAGYSPHDRRLGSRHLGSELVMAARRHWRALQAESAPTYAEVANERI